MGLQRWVPRIKAVGVINIWNGMTEQLTNLTTVTSPLFSLIFIIPSLLASFIHLANFFQSDLPMTTSFLSALGMYAGLDGRI